MAFLILGFFTFLYLLAIEPELINKTSKKHQNIISKIESNLKIQKILIKQHYQGVFLKKSAIQWLFQEKFSYFAEYMYKLTLVYSLIILTLSVWISKT